MPPETHLETVGKALLTCEACGNTFVLRRSWGRFCSPRCRNAFHQAEARIEAIRERAVQMYEALLKITWQGGERGQEAEQVIKGLKPPATPKQLLEEKGKA